MYQPRSIELVPNVWFVWMDYCSINLVANSMIHSQAGHAYNFVSKQYLINCCLDSQHSRNILCTSIQACWSTGQRALIFIVAFWACILLLLSFQVACILLTTLQCQKKSLKRVKILLMAFPMLQKATFGSPRSTLSLKLQAEQLLYGTLCACLLQQMHRACAGTKIETTPECLQRSCSMIHKAAF